MILISNVSAAGNWSMWVNTTECSKTCGGGTWTVERKCDNPEPADGGQECERLDGTFNLIETNSSAPCMEQNCPGNYYDY